MAGGIFDGTYKGVWHGASNNHPACKKDTAPVADSTIQNNHFTRKVGNATADIQIAPDGTFLDREFYDVGGTIGVMTFSGKITDNNLEADAESERLTRNQFGTIF